MQIRQSDWEDVLQFDWELVQHEIVSAVIARNERVMNDGSYSWDQLAFVLQTGAIVLAVSLDTDEITVTNEPAPKGDDWVPIESLRHAVGKPLGWCWVGTNYRGYHDSFTLALGDMVPDALRPQLMFVGEGATLCCLELSPLSHNQR